MLGLTLRVEVKKNRNNYNKMTAQFCVLYYFKDVRVPGDIIYDVGLQQEVTAWKEVLSDEVLVGPHSYTVTHAKRAQDIQDLEADGRMFQCCKAARILTFNQQLRAMRLV